METQAGVYPFAWCIAGDDYSPPSLKRFEGINDANVRYLDTELRERSGAKSYKGPV